MRAAGLLRVSLALANSDVHTVSGISHDEGTIADVGLSHWQIDLRLAQLTERLHALAVNASTVLELSLIHI